MFVVVLGPVGWGAAAGVALGYAMRRWIGQTPLEINWFITNDEISIQVDIERMDLSVPIVGNSV